MLSLRNGRARVVSTLAFDGFAAKDLVTPDRNLLCSRAGFERDFVIEFSKSKSTRGSSRESCRFVYLWGKIPPHQKTALGGLY